MCKKYAEAARLARRAACILAECGLGAEEGRRFLIAAALSLEARLDRKAARNRAMAESAEKAKTASKEWQARLDTARQALLASQGTPRS